MTSKNSIIDEIPPNALPPTIINNFHERLLPRQIRATAIQLMHKERLDPHAQVVDYPLPRPPVPTPYHSLVLTWSPNCVSLQLDEEPVITRLWVLNLSSRSIYIHCCGFWNDAARLGASWCCCPRTRFKLAPGLGTQILIQATPRDAPPPIGKVYCSLQIAAQHMRDIVTGYFSVPIKAKFLKHIPPAMGEGE